MSLAHVVRQARGVADDERRHCLMSCLPKRISPQPVRHSRAYPWERRLGIMPQCGIGSGSQTSIFACASISSNGARWSGRFRPIATSLQLGSNCRLRHASGLSPVVGEWPLQRSRRPELT